MNYNYALFTFEETKKDIIISTKRIDIQNDIFGTSFERRTSKFLLFFCRREKT
jgi:hypothetical protein